MQPPPAASPSIICPHQARATKPPSIDHEMSLEHCSAECVLKAALAAAHASTCVMVVVVILIFCFCGGTNRGHRMISMLGRKGVPELDGEALGPLVVLMQSVKQSNAWSWWKRYCGASASPMRHAWVFQKRRRMRWKRRRGGGRCMALRLCGANKRASNRPIRTTDGGP